MKKEMEKHRVLSPSDLLRWMQDLRPIQHINSNGSPGLPLPLPTIEMSTNIVRDYFMVPMQEKGIHIDEFLTWISGTTGAFMSYTERMHQSKEEQKYNKMTKTWEASTPSFALSFLEKVVISTSRQQGKAVRTDHLSNGMASVRKVPLPKFKVLGYDYIFDRQGK